MERLAFLEAHLGLAGKVALEVGALDRPVLTRRHADVRYLDHLDTAGLREKYGNDPAVDTARIVDVSYVQSEGSLRAAIPDGESFDLIVASHVLEHVPDPVRWLADAGSLVRDGGHVFLVLPDRRFTFDIARRDSTVSDWIGWHLRRLDRPAPEQVFDHFAGVRTVPPDRAWRGAARSEFPLMYEAAVAYDVARSAASDDRYVDVHCSVFTPFSFVELCRGLDRLNLFPFRIAGFRPTQPGGIEFLVLLQAQQRPGRPLLDRERLQALARRAGYAGDFGGGLFRRAMDAEPALRSAYENLLAGEQAAAEAARAADEAARFPALDPILHHEAPSPPDIR